MNRVTVYLSPEDTARYKALGGVGWFRAALAAAQLPAAAPQQGRSAWALTVEQRQEVAKDPRSAKVVASVWGLQVNAVWYLRRTYGSLP
ncbi:MAG: hypothetical protein EOO54_03765 [Haliea sp.]|nr:MAG: hypothetical protein EOO54_03765 [Haliea sp.]